MAVDKLVDSTQLNNGLTSVANAIRIKGGTSAILLFPSDFVSAINAIQTGGSTGGAGIFKSLEVQPFTISGITNPNYVPSSISFTINHTLNESPNFILIYPKQRFVPTDDNQTGAYIRVLQFVLLMDIGNIVVSSAFIKGIQLVCTVSISGQNAKQNSFAVYNNVVNGITSSSITFLGATAYSNCGIQNGDYYAVMGKIDAQHDQGEPVVVNS